MTKFSALLALLLSERPVIRCPRAVTLPQLDSHLNQTRKRPTLSANVTALQQADAAYRQRGRVRRHPAILAIRHPAKPPEAHARREASRPSNLRLHACAGSAAQGKHLATQLARQPLAKSVEDLPARKGQYPISTPPRHPPGHQHAAGLCTAQR